MQHDLTRKRKTNNHEQLNMANKSFFESSNSCCEQKFYSTNGGFEFTATLCPSKKDVYFGRNTHTHTQFLESFSSISK